MARRGRDRGQAAVLMVGALAVTGALVVGLVHMVAVVAARQQAQTAADAAALAGVWRGVATAADVASRNGAVLVRWRWDGDDLLVEVQVSTRAGVWATTVGATARATRAP